MISVGLINTVGLIVVAVFVGVDVYLATDKIKGNTWSEVIRSWGTLTLVVPWLWGILGGHFFHPFMVKVNPVIQKPGNFALLIWLSCVITMLGFAMSRADVSTIPFMLVALALGIVAGVFLWPV